LPENNPSDRNKSGANGERCPSAGAKQRRHAVE
jgi:hypothetical protein